MKDQVFFGLAIFLAIFIFNGLIFGAKWLSETLFLCGHQSRFHY